MSKVALITGITGQDGSYLAELLLSKDYTVHGLIRRSSSFNTERIDHLYQDPHENDPKLILHYGDITDSNSISKLIHTIQPNEVYNLAAQSHVKVSFDIPVYTAETVAIGTVKLLEAIRVYNDSVSLDNKCRVYQASSSEMFGNASESPQRETTPFRPRSPYAVAKVYAHMINVNYRESYNMHASCGILYNHESTRRGETFVTRKITRAVGRIKTGLQNILYLGNLDATRDWGFAGDYVEAMWMMLQQETPDDYIISTGNTNSVRAFCKLAFELVDLDYKDYVAIDPKYYRPAEVDTLLGDPSKANKILKWKPKVDFKGLVKMMTLHDLKLAEIEVLERGLRK